MLNFMAVMAAASTLLPSALATFDSSGNTNMAVYWGQGPDQEPLEFFCDDDNIDIIQIGFVNVFPDQSGGYPGTNFGNQCGSETYDNINGSSSLLLSHCPGIGPNITYCQSIGKKILLSIGGSSPNNSHLDNDVSAVEFATFLWEAFGPEDPSKTTPRPFGNACVDGFDFDIENVLISGEDSGDLDRGYGTMVNTLRTLYDTDKSKTYYVSAAPQCLVPDAHLADAIETSPFDFLFVQFYNTPQCSARAYFDHSYEGTYTNISFASWVDFVHDHSYNPKTKVYLGLPAAPSVAYDAKMYLQPNEANEIIKALQCGYEHEFGGVMIYEATFSQNNQINGQPYADVLKGYLESTGCTVSAPVTSSATVHSTRIAPSSSALAVTSSVPAPTKSGATTAYVSLSMSAYGSTPSPVGPSVSNSGLPTRGSPSSGLYRNSTSAAVSTAPASAVTSSTSTPITISPLPGSAEFTSLITSTITTCHRCSEQTESASVPVLSSNTSGSPGQVGTTAPAPSLSNSIALSPSGASPASSSTPLPVQTTYTTTTIVSTLTTTCSKATTFSLSPSGKVYTATADETLTIKDCPCTLTHTAIGYSAPTNGDFSSEHMSPGIPGGPATDANDFLTGTSYFGTPGISGAKNAPSSPESGESNSSPQAGSSSAPEESESTAEVSHGSSSLGSSGALNAGSQSTSNSESGTSSPGAESPGNAVSQSNSDSESAASSPSVASQEKAESQNNSNGESGALSPSEASPGQAGSQSNSNSEIFASSLSALSHDILNAGSPSISNSESGASSPGSGNKAAVPQQSSPEQPEAQGSPSEEGATGSVSKAGAQALASGVAGGHIPVVTMEIVPIPESSGEIAQSGKASQNGKSSGQANEQESGQDNGQQSGQQSGQQHEQQGGQQSGQQNEQQGGQQSGQQSGQQGNSASLAVNNGTAPVSPSGTFSTGPSGTAPAIQGVGSGSPANSSQKEFKGAASRIGGSLFVMIAASAIILLL